MSLASPDWAASLASISLSSKGSKPPRATRTKCLPQRGYFPVNHLTFWGPRYIPSCNFIHWSRCELASGRCGGTSVSLSRHGLPEQMILIVSVPRLDYCSPVHLASARTVFDLKFGLLANSPPSPFMFVSQMNWTSIEVIRGPVIQVADTDNWVESVGSHSFPR